ncbi:ROK family protein [Pedobacter heparinus]|uniref:ROK family protein n=1 Tax=Pedobacter heparinus TaxID=984 RepID=UPI0029316DFE|nr:ROK family protein [Pedobacter heparinus]
MEQLVLSADIGGSHITAALIDLNKKEELKDTWSRTKLNSAGAAIDIIKAWAETLENSCRGYDITSLKINIAMPGPMNYKKGISKIKGQGKYELLYGLNIKEMLARRLGVQPSAIHFINDAACFLKGEVFSGSLTGYDHAIGLTLGTGLGTSYLVNGKAVDSGLWCMPFLKGIAEDYISTRWFVARFFELSGIAIKDVKDLVDNHRQSPYFKEVFSEFSLNLASFIHKFIRKKMPLAVVLGGNITNAEAYFIEDTRRHLALIMGYSFPVKKSILGEKAALLGAGSGC